MDSQLIDSRPLDALLRSRPVYALAVLALFACLAGELWLSVRQLSQTADEGAHLYSGYQYWKARDFGINPEHPPLLKLVAAAPLLTLPLRQPHPPAFNAKAEEYIGGGQLLYGNDADRLLGRARRAASLFSFLLAALLFAAGYEMFGPATALLALVLCVFEPNLLAHGALVTTDMVATCTIFAAVYALYRYVKRRTPGRLAVVGMALGLAAAAKFSAIVLLPIFLITLMTIKVVEGPTARVGKAASDTGHNYLRRPWQRALGWVGVVILAWIILWAFYGFAYPARPGTAVLAPTLPAYAALLNHPWEAHLILLLARWHILPEAFLYGVVDLVVYGRKMPSFLLGQTYPGTTMLYFPIAFLIKSTLPVLLLLAALPFLLLRQRVRYGRELVFLLVPAVVYLVISLFAPQNIGVRHILPIFPFVLLLAALAASLLWRRSRTGAYVTGALLVFHVVSSAWAFPDYLPYANEAFGGPGKSYRLLTDSNADWGQGLKEVEAYLTKNQITDCWFVPHGGEILSHPAYYHIACKPLPSGFQRMAGLPIPIIPPTVHGTILISASEASGLFWGPQTLNPYADLLKRRPDDMIGHTVLVFRGDVNLPLASAQSHASAAGFLMQQGKLPEALSEAQAAANLVSDAPDIQTTLGAVLLRSGRTAEAHQAFQAALNSASRLDPQNLLKTDKNVAALNH